MSLVVAGPSENSATTQFTHRKSTESDACTVSMDVGSYMYKRGVVAVINEPP